MVSSANWGGRGNTSISKLRGNLADFAIICAEERKIDATGLPGGFNTVCDEWFAPEQLNIFPWNSFGSAARRDDCQNPHDVSVGEPLLKSRWKF